MKLTQTQVNEARGKRYTTDQRAEVIQFVEAHNLANRGRGGLTEAVKKFGISQLTIRTWLREEGIPRSSVFQSAPDAPNMLRRLAEVEEELKPLLCERARLRSDLKL